MIHLLKINHDKKELPSVIEIERMIKAGGQNQIIPIVRHRYTSGNEGRITEIYKWNDEHENIQIIYVDEDDRIREIFLSPEDYELVKKPTQLEQLEKNIIQQQQIYEEDIQKMIEDIDEAKEKSHSNLIYHLEWNFGRLYEAHEKEFMWSQAKDIITAEGSEENRAANIINFYKSTLSYVINNRLKKTSVDGHGIKYMAQDAARRHLIQVLGSMLKCLGFITDHNMREY